MSKGRNRKYSLVYSLVYTIFYFALHTETSVQLSLELQIPIHKATRVELIHMDIRYLPKEYPWPSEKETQRNQSSSRILQLELRAKQKELTLDVQHLVPDFTTAVTDRESGKTWLSWLAGINLWTLQHFTDHPVFSSRLLRMTTPPNIQIVSTNEHQFCVLPIQQVGGSLDDVKHPVGPLLYTCQPSSSGITAACCSSKIIEPII